MFKAVLLTTAAAVFITGSAIAGQSDSGGKQVPFPRLHFASKGTGRNATPAAAQGADKKHGVWIGGSILASHGQAPDAAHGPKKGIVTNWDDMKGASGPSRHAVPIYEGYCETGSSSADCSGSSDGSSSSAGKAGPN